LKTQLLLLIVSVALVYYNISATRLSSNLPQEPEHHYVSKINDNTPDDSSHIPDQNRRVLLKENIENSLYYTWINKKVYDSKLINGCENLSGWTLDGVGKISITEEHSIEGSKSLRFKTLMRDEELIKKSPGKRMMGMTRLILNFNNPQDWTEYNRIALWVYVHPSEVRVNTFYLLFKCLEEPTSITDPKYATVIQNLTPGQWNYVLWEIPNLLRSKVTSFTIFKLATGNDSEEDGTVIYDIDKIELQRVDTDKFEGWEVEKDKISFNHIGYKPAQSKIALGSSIKANSFQLIDAKTGDIVLTKNIQNENNRFGQFQILDFSKITIPGKYFLWAGETVSKPFLISDSLWNTPTLKALNFYYSQRCGFDVPGVHPECHKDMFGIHNEKKKIINGGWHDAGDLSQGSFRTAMSVYPMLEYFNQLKIRNIDFALQDKLIESILWGLDWLLKTRFEDGYRITWGGMGIYTDGIIGNIDDATHKAINNPWENFIASGAEALAFNVLKNLKPDLADNCLEAAKEDWEAAVKLQSGWLEGDSVVLYSYESIDNSEIVSHRWFSGGTYFTLSWGIISSINLYLATGDDIYRERAIEYGSLLISCQEQVFLEGIPITGFFYTDPAKGSVVNHRHPGFEESPLLALSLLCKTFPDYKDWINWYSSVTLHSEYFLKQGSTYNTPYDLIPNSIHKRSDIQSVKNTDLQEMMMTQLLDGTKLSDEYYLRNFPIWTTRTHHGSTTIRLSQTLALTLAMLLRNNFEIENLVNKQMQWVFGGNPFTQCLMYGEGYDYPTLYSYNPGNVVGALPCGIDCVKNDEPFWSGSNHATYKEIWIVPVSRFLWNAVYLGTPGFIQGGLREKKSGSINFLNKITGVSTSAEVKNNGTFKHLLPAGEYEVEIGNIRKNLTVVSGNDYNLVLNKKDNFNFDIQMINQDAKNRSLIFEVETNGNGRHQLSMRVFNCNVEESEKIVECRDGESIKLYWNVDVIDPNKPWVVVIVPDGDLVWKEELTGKLEVL
ncbi:glycoside hydrolase family 9 protein, partial [Bacteroidota bacterium]